MNRYRLIVALFILSAVAAAPCRADTGTVDAEVVAAAKKGPAQLKALEQRAIETLKSNAPTMEKDRASRILRVIGTADSVEALGLLLTDEKLSHIARHALESMPCIEADEALSRALGKTSGRVKVGIIHSLAMRANSRNVDTLASLLNDADAEIAVAAAWGLGRIGSPKAVGALRQSYKNASGTMRDAAADGLLTAADRLVCSGDLQEAVAIYQRLRGPDATEHVRLGAFAGLIEAQPDKAMEMLIEAIGSDHWKTRGMAIDMIVALDGERVTERFSTGLDKMDPGTQILVLGALVARGEKRALRPVITKAVSGSNPEIRTLAIKSLGDVGDAHSVQVLVDVMHTGSEEEKNLAASSLRRLSGENVNTQIVQSMKTSPTQDRVALIEIMRDRDATEAVDALLAAGSDADVDVRKAALRALADLAGPDDQKALIRLLVNLKGDGGRAEAERAVISVSRKLDDSAAMEAILAPMDSTTAAKCSLLRVLGGVGNAKGFHVVRKALEDGDADVRDAAVRTLADWPDSTAARTLLAVFQTTSNQTHRILALRGCVRQLSTGISTSASMLEICSELMKGADRPEEKKLVLARLGKSGYPGAAKIVEPLLADNSVRAEAELAMLGIIRNMMAAKPGEAEAAAGRLRSKSQDEAVKKEAAAVIRLVRKFEDHIMAWQVSGPYSKPFADTFETPFAPEEPGAENVEWRTLAINKTGNRPWMFDLRAALGGQRKAGYVRTWVHSDKQKAARLEFGTDDGNKLWLNGKLIHADNTRGAATPGEYKVAVTLEEGWNRLLLKVVQETGPWQFCFAVRKPNGGKLDGIGIQANTPAR